MRVYISGAISGVDNYKERFAKAAEELKAKGYEVVNPAALDDDLPDSLTYEEHMKVDMLLLDMSEAIYMLKGWEKSCGANREYGYAIAKGKKVMRE